MEKLTSELVKRVAKENGADLIGIAPVSRFKDAPPETNPLNIYPKTKSIVVMANRILEGSYKGIQENTDWSSYWIYGYGSGIYSSLGSAGGARAESSGVPFAEEAQVSPGCCILLALAS